VKAKLDAVTLTLIVSASDLAEGQNCDVSSVPVAVNMPVAMAYSKQKVFLDCVEESVRSLQSQDSPELYTESIGIGARCGRVVRPLTRCGEAARESHVVIVRNTKQR
jgi:hypothetical protein